MAAAPNWCSLSAAAAAAALDCDPDTGLTQAEAARRLAHYGPNELVESGGKSAWRILLEQFSSVMVAVLAGAALLSLALGDVKDTLVILAIVILNAALGFSQEQRAERALAALKRLAETAVRVRRDGAVVDVAASELVPGDVLLLAAGNRVAADARLLESASLRTLEAALTGEAAPVDKSIAPLATADPPLGDRHNMVYLGTNVVYGRGVALVTATGMATELGHIAALVGSAHAEPTPLQKRLAGLGRVLALTTLLLVALLFVLGLVRGDDPATLLLTSVSVAVAVIPEGLPAIVTIALALGAGRMLQRKALIRRLPAVETLGSVTVICSDKTGTLTRNRMTVSVLDVAGHSIAPDDLPALGAGEDATPEREQALALLLIAAALCNDATPGEPAGQDNATIDDPTETALLAAAGWLGLGKPELERSFPRTGELPFDAERKRMTTLHRQPDSYGELPTALSDLCAAPFAAAGSSHVAFAKGAVDSLLDVCDCVWLEGECAPLTGDLRRRIMAAHNRLAERGMRVLGIAYRPLAVVDGPTPTEIEQNLVFIGMVGLIDPLRDEARAAVQTCQQAGVRTMLITGDHPLTALAVASALGIAADGRILSGQQLAALTPEQLVAEVGEVNVYARVAPEHKLRIVRALQSRHEIVAMTGDGVNDAPALKQADIGVAMGLGGTDVAREAAAMVLLDDNFATIVAAVAEGRLIYDNIRKFIKYILAGNLAEFAIMLLAPFFGLPLALLPTQILWVNLVTDGLPALALSYEPAEHDLMRRPPHPPTESVFSRGLGRDIVWAGLLLAALALGAGAINWEAGQESWQTIIFTALVLGQMSNAVSMRSERESLLSLGLRSNKPLLGAVALTTALQLLVVYAPPLQGFFHTVALSAEELALSFALALLLLLALEVAKWTRRQRPARQQASERQAALRS